MELLIAIGILAVGGAMAAALFPAAIKENQSSYNDTLGTIICDNALAVIKSIYVNDASATNGITNSANPRYIQTIQSGYSFLAPQIAGRSGYLGRICHYPVNDASDTRGFYFMALRNGGNNDYTFVIIAYQQQSVLPAFTNRSCTVHNTRADIILVPDADADGDNPGDYSVNTLVIIDSGPAGTQQGEYARVVQINDISGGNTELTLDHNLNTPLGATVQCWTFQEANTIRSPAMNVLVTRTALREN